LVTSENVAASLRSFELELLSLLGYAVNLVHEFGSQDSLDAARLYEYRMEQGPVPVERADGALVFRGAILTGIAEQRFDDPDILRAANRLLRETISFHLGGKELKSRKVLMELHRGRIAPSKPREQSSD
jgi:DNA repair protein RecO (recombination protein O)